MGGMFADRYVNTYAARNNTCCASHECVTVPCVGRYWTKGEAEVSKVSYALSGPESCFKFIALLLTQTVTVYIRRSESEPAKNTEFMVFPNNYLLTYRLKEFTFY